MHPDLPHLLVDNNSHSSLCHIVHSSSLPVVELVRHSFLKGTITLFKDHHSIIVDEATQDLLSHLRYPQPCKFSCRWKYAPPLVGEKTCITKTTETFYKNLTMLPKLFGLEVPGPPTVAIGVNHLENPIKISRSCITNSERPSSLTFPTFQRKWSTWKLGLLGMRRISAHDIKR